MQAQQRIRRNGTGIQAGLRALATIVAVCFLQIHVVDAAPSEGLDLFETKIRPILVEHCQKCHGSEKQWSGLRLDSRSAALKGGDGGPAFVEGDPEGSEIIIPYYRPR